MPKNTLSINLAGGKYLLIHGYGIKKGIYSMDIRALKEIVENQENHLEERATDLGQKFDVARATALIVLDKGYDALVGKQVWVFDNVVRPLIENVKCHGYQGPFGEDNYECHSLLEDESLEDCYANENFLCDRCQGNADSDAHSKQRFMED